MPGFPTTSSGTGPSVQSFAGGSASGNIAIPNYMVGKNVTAAVLQGASLDAYGGLTLVGGSPDMHVLGVFDSFKYEAEAGLAEISPLDARMKNYQPTKEDFTITIGCITNADGYNLLKYAYLNINYLRVEIDMAPPGGTPGKFVAVGVRATGNDAIVEDKNGFEITLKPCGIAVWYGTGTPPI